MTNTDNVADAIDRLADSLPATPEPAHLDTEPLVRAIIGAAEVLADAVTRLRQEEERDRLLPATVEAWAFVWDEDAEALDALPVIAWKQDRDGDLRPLLGDDVAASDVVRRLVLHYGPITPEAVRRIAPGVAEGEAQSLLYRALCMGARLEGEEWVLESVEDEDTAQGLIEEAYRLRAYGTSVPLVPALAERIGLASPESEERPALRQSQ